MRTTRLTYLMGLLIASFFLANAALLLGSEAVFTPTGSMGTARGGQTATLLPNGKVLITGGMTSPFQLRILLASAELYDPATGTFLPTGSMGEERLGHTATLLPNGKVLITGGFKSYYYDSAMSSVELYDPETGTFSPAGNMHSPRYYHTVTLLPDGKVLIVGGSPVPYQTTTSAELYDPATGDFTLTGSLMLTRMQHTAILLQSGKVLIAGGGNWTQGVLASAELYNPATGIFTVTASLATRRTYIEATLLNSGKVLIAGGYNGETLSGVELYDPATETFSVTGSLGTGREQPKATLLPNGKVLIAGGYSRVSNDNLNSAEVYDPTIGVFTATASMGSPRGGHTATLLQNGEVLIVGSDTDTSSASAELYWDPTNVPNHTVTFVEGAGGTISGSQTQIVEDGGNCTEVMAVPDDGRSFVNWTGTGGFVTTSVNPLTVTNVTADMTINANFSASTYIISGTVTLGGSPLAGVVLNGLPGSPATDGAGFYTTNINAGWSGTVTPILAGYTFTPANRTYNNVEVNQTAQDYVATSGSSGIPATERAALIDLYNSTNGAGWTNNTNWNGAPGTECTWFGVTCDGGQTTVQQLNLSNNNLVGTLPASLSSLTSLQSLSLVSNELTGSIPSELGNLASLQFLELRSNQLTGTISPELGNLTNLGYLDLAFNQLTGSIPTWFDTLTNLRHLDLASNRLTGSIPIQYGNLTNLHLDINQLTGSIPTELGNLTNLRVLSLSSNQLTGNIPTELGNLMNLQILNLSNNQLAGSIPTELGTLTNLQVLNLSSSQLTGNIPTELGNLGNLQVLDLGNNQLTGSIPTQLGNLANLQRLLLSSNLLMGSIPIQLSSLNNLQYLHLHINQLTGSIPPELGNLTNLQNLWLSSNQLSGSMPTELGNLTNLQNLSLSSNQLTSSIPTELGSLTNLQVLDMGANQLTGSIPTELGNLTNLQVLNLSSNQLTGSIPTQFGTLTHLHLDNNQLTGSIPTELGNLTTLLVLSLSSNQLTGNIPTEIGNLTNLQILNLSFNQLSGSIPTELGTLTNLQILNLSNNQLAGSIPTELGNLANLQVLDMGANQLTGTMPIELGNLTELVYLYLNYNQLTGLIPPQLGALTKLRVLYLFSNQLTGSIPTELGNLYSLQHLQLDSNRLSGSIPAALGNLTQLQTLALNSNQLSGGIPASLVNLTLLSSSDTNIGYNALYTTDIQLIAFLDSKDADWAATQTIVPTGVQAIAVSSGTILVSWTPIIYTGDGGGYRVYLSSTSGGPYSFFGQTSDKTVSFLHVTGLSPSTPYYFVVNTRTDAHSVQQNIVDSEYSAEVTATTQIGTSISGTITHEGSTLAGVVLNGLPGNPTTDGAGFYTASVDSGWSGTVTPILAGYTFTPANRTYSNVEVNQSAQDYVATSGSAGIPATERAALIDLYNSTNGSGWTNNANWNGAPGTECTWFGVTCDGGQITVQQLNLSSNNMVGTLPGSLGDLSNLTILDLSKNQMSGSIPVELGNLNNLQGLNLTDNHLSGVIPAELATLVNLEVFSFYGNQLTGAVPAWFGNLSKLRRAYFSYNQFSGLIPAEIGNLVNLTELGLEGNQFVGTVPVEFSNLTNLFYLRVNQNQLTGPIPAWIGGLTNISCLALDNNQFTGQIPESFQNLTNIEYLYLHFNQLTGSIPTWMGNLTRLKYLLLYGNQFSGSIPTQLGNLTNLENLDLSLNQFTGPIPDQLGNLTNLQELWLDINQLTGSIPTQLGNLSNLQDLYLNNNQLTGTIPTQLGALTKLQHLKLSNNQLTGSIPSQLGDLTSLRDLSLASNLLTGSIPPELDNLANLRQLSLGNNPSLTAGPIPDWLQTKTPLTSLDLSATNRTGAIPSWLGSLTNLNYLILGNNPTLTADPIPDWLQNLTQLNHLDLSATNRTGAIPSWLGNRTSLRYLYLGSNQLSGSIPDLSALTGLRILFLCSNPALAASPIPDWLQTMTQLYSLDLSATNRTGNIPSWLGNLTSLQRLYLNSNQLAGSIPPELGNLTNLRRLSLSSNQLTGAVPSSVTNLAKLTAVGSDFRWNGLYSSDPAVVTFLNNQQTGGDWQSTQTVPVTGLTAGVATPSSVALAWAPIAYTGDTGGYRVLYGTTAGGPYTLFGTTSDKSATGLTITGLNPGTTYNVVVQTVTNPHAKNQNTVISELSAAVTATPIDVRTLAVSRTGTGSGTVTSSPAGINCGATCSGQFTPGSQVTLVASPVSGSVFSGWSGEGCSGTGTCIVNMDQARNATAAFDQQPMLLTVNNVGPGTGAVTSDLPGISCATLCSTMIPAGTVVTLTANADPGFELSGWFGECAGLGACTLTMDGPKLALATYKQVGDPYTVLRHLLPGAHDGARPNSEPVSDGTYLYGMTQYGGGASLGVVYRTRLDGSEYTLIHEFMGGASDGSSPSGALTLDGAVLYGMTSGGGASDKGAIFKIHTDGTGFAVLHSFAGGVSDGRNPNGTLSLADSVLYGMTGTGGVSNLGTIFKINPDGTGFAVLHEFTGGAGDGSNPLGALNIDGAILYGMTQMGGASDLGTIFKISVDGTGFTVLHSFSGGVDDGSNPNSSLTFDGGFLYGMTQYGGASDLGTIFKINTDSTNFAVLHEFTGGAGDGSNPLGALTFDGEILYGMTSEGGTLARGAIFKINRDGTSFAILHAFAAGSDGRNPLGSLTLNGFALYGMTERGGAVDQGTIFKIKLDGTEYSVLHAFAGPTGDGNNPYGALTSDGEILYGMTASGGASDMGTIFKVNPDGMGYAIIHTFAWGADDGALPFGDLTFDGSVFYGMTVSGGASEGGIIFKVNPDGTGFAVLHAFASGASDGRSPYGSLTLSDGVLFGMTRYGGVSNLGTIFKINPDGTGFALLHSFTGGLADGSRPLYGSLTLDGSVLYGMTGTGGVSNLGTIFKINPDGTGFAVLHAFTGGTGDGSTPWGSLTINGGALYGMTRLGGASDLGTIFKVNPDGTGFTVLHTFAGGVGDGGTPRGSLIIDGSALYGMTSQGGASNKGTIFKINPDGTGFTVLHDFTGGSSDGRTAWGSLTLDGSVLYGTTVLGGAGNSGVIFSLNNAFKISGSIARDGLGLAGVTMAGLPGSPVTNSSGVYTATVPLAWSGTVTPTLADNVFSPVSRSYSNVQTDQSGQDYSASLITHSLTVTRVGTGTGTVNSDPVGINCGLICQASFIHSTDVTLTVTSSNGSTFAGWSGVCSGTGICQVTMDAAKSVIATFSPLALTSETVIVTHTAGTGGSTWTSDLVLHNLDSGNATCQLSFLRNNSSPLIYALSVSEVEGITVIPDVVSSVFGVNATGALGVECSSRVAVGSRVHNNSGPGQTFFGLGDWGLVTSAAPARIIGAAETTQSRSNFWLVNRGNDPATIRVDVTNEVGQLVGVRNYVLTERGFIQANRILYTLGLSNIQNVVLTATLTSGSGPVAFIGSLIDNFSGDPATLAAFPATGSSETLVMPAVRGSFAGAELRTDIYAMNPGSSSVPLEIELILADGSRTVQSVTLAPSAAMSWNDALMGLFGVDTGSGVVHVRSTSPILAQARLWTATAPGSFQEALPGFPASMTAGMLLRGSTLPGSTPIEVRLLANSTGAATGAFYITPPTTPTPTGSIRAPFTLDPLGGTIAGIGLPPLFNGVSMGEHLVESSLPIQAFSLQVNAANGDPVVAPLFVSVAPRPVIIASLTGVQITLDTYPRWQGTAWSWYMNGSVVGGASTEQLLATPGETYHVVSTNPLFSGAGVSRPVVAASYGLNVNLTGTGGGTVTSSPSGIDCGASCSAEFVTGLLGTLTAIPNAGSTFTGWTGEGCSGIGLCQVIMSGSKVVTATFTAIASQTITVTKEGTGTGTITTTPSGIDCGSTCQGSFAAGSNIILSAVPSFGSIFVNWTGTGGLDSTANPLTVNALATDMTITAHFSPSNQMKVKLIDSQGSPLAGGQVSYAGSSWKSLGTTDTNGEVVAVLLPGRYTFRMTFGGLSKDIAQDTGANPVVTFQTINATVRLIDSSNNNPIAGGVVTYAGSSWQTIGTTTTNGQVSKELLSGLYTFRMTYGGLSKDIAQDVGTNSAVVFQISNTIIKLTDSVGNPIAGGVVTYAGSSWQTIGTTAADGQVSKVLLPGRYTFRMTYGGFSKDIAQDVGVNSIVVFQTVYTIIKLTDSVGNPIAGGVVTYAGSSWQTIGTTTAYGQVSKELLPGRFTFRMTYGGFSKDIAQDVGVSSIIVFQTVNVIVRLTDSVGNPIAGGVVTYAGSSWQTIGTTTADGQVSKELFPGRYTFRMTYGGFSKDIAQDVGVSSVVIFQTVNVIVRLTDSVGNPIAGGVVTYAGSSWQTIGTTTADGQVSKELFPGRYTFRMTYGGLSKDIAQDVGVNSVVVFQTVNVTVRLIDGASNPVAGGVVTYAGLSWRAFGSTAIDGQISKELLPGRYTFRMMYSGRSRDIAQDVGVNPLVTFSSI